jgi:hypothetical protein
MLPTLSKVTELMPIMFNKMRNRPPVTMVAKTVPLVIGDGQYGTT